MKRFGYLSIIILFLGCIYLPMILWIVGKDQNVSMAEKRRLAKQPRLEWSLASFGKFPDQFETYYNDHFGLREQMVIWYNFFYFRVLRKSPLPLVTVGRDEWLFYNAENVLFDYLGLVHYSEEKFETWKRVIDDRREWLNDMGIRSLFVVAPTKMMIYPEQLPVRVQKQAGVPVLDRFTDYLNRSSDVDGFMDLREVLREGKKHRQVYFRTDTHWNPDGAYYAYREIMKQVKQWFPRVQIVPESRLKRTVVSHRGDICIALNLKSISSEQAVNTVIEPSCSAAEYTRVKVKTKPTGSEANNPNYMPVQNGCSGAPLTALIVHDSFGLFLRPYFNETFGRVFYSNYIDLKDLKELIKREKPDLVIALRVARNLSSMLDPDLEVEKYIIEKHLAGSRDVRFRFDAADGGELFKKTHDLVVEGTPKGLLLKATGNDPSMEIQFDATTGGDPLLVRLSLDSPQDTFMEIYYTTTSASEFSPSRVLRRKIRRGHNELLFRLPHPRTAGRIRLDPGMVRGDYLLRFLEIIRERNVAKGPVE